MVPPKIVPTKKAHSKDSATVRSSKLWGHPSYIYEDEVAEKVCRSEETYYTHTNSQPPPTTKDIYMAR